MTLLSFLKDLSHYQDTYYHPLYANPVKIIAAHPTILFSTSDKFLISFKR
jgi:hypothetical protein